jgi:hypothetical protein
METQMVDVMVHIDESIDEAKRTQVQDSLRGLEGVVAVGFGEGKPHLLLVEYNPAQVTSHGVLECVTSLGVHAELVGM